ncbi:helix-turn-helix domain-containing protein [Priestia megaterium]
MGKREDLTGQVFNKLTVIEYMGLDATKKQAMWKCRCECGKEIIVRKRNLKVGHTKSCGCISKVNKYREDLTGRVFGRLTVIEYGGFDQKHKVATWKCKCECGEEITTRKQNLLSGDTRSCGCLQRETVTATATKHGLHNHRLYKIWHGMRGRCNNPNAPHYERYGGRGIRVCEEWDKSFETFYKDMIDTYKEGLTIDRIDVNGNYEPGNCKWATMMEQGNNRRNNRVIEVFGETMTIAQAARKYNVKERTLRDRIKRGLVPEEAVTLPPQTKNASTGKRKQK